MPFTVSGTGCSPGAYTGTQSFQWASGASCTVQFASPASNSAGTQYLMTGWQDGPPSNPRVITATGQSVTYTALFQLQFQVSVTANPPSGGTVTGSGWVNMNGTAAVTAVPAAGYRFVNWSGSVANANAANTTTSPVTWPQTITANFQPLTNTPPGKWSATLIADVGIGFGLNDSGQAAVNSFGYPFLWNPVNANSSAGSLVMLSSSNTLSATEINNYGQVLLSGSNLANSVWYAINPVSLWTPAAPQGTVGTTITLSTTATNQATTLNSFGEVVSDVGGVPAIWVPTAPNGTSGSTSANSLFQGVAAMNSFGQAVLNSTSPTLFTPLSPHGTGGSFTTIPGLPGASKTTLVAISTAGTVLGYSCVPQASGGCQNQSFIWTPFVLNGTSGSTLAMPVPAGFVDVTATAMNDAGAVVGTMAAATGHPLPFLFTGGTYYDLTAINGVPAGSVPYAINQASQILINVSYSAYLVSPQPPVQPPAGAVAVTITANVTPQAFVVSGSGCAPGGYSAPQTFQWAPGAICTVQFVSPYSQQMGTQYVFTGWQDGSMANPRSFAVPSQPATFIANFKKQFGVAVTSEPAVGGTVSGAGYFDDGDSATLTAVPAAGYRFAGWSGNPVDGSSANPVTFRPSYFAILTANFEPVTNAVPGSWEALAIGGGFACGLNNFGQVTGSANSTPFLWNPLSANSVAGTVVNLTGSSGFSAGIAINDDGQVLLSQFVPSGSACISMGAVGLWTPSAANGVTGVAMQISNGVAANTPALMGAALNGYGQVWSYLDGSPSLWTPVTGNGQSGAPTATPQLPWVTAMNSLGQAILTPPNYLQPAAASLFTPQARNGTAGTFTTIAGLGGATVLVAITETGSVLGFSSVPQMDGSYVLQGFVWTPSAPNATTGTTTALPIPAGFVGFQPASMNAAGDVVGTMRQAAGNRTPFLFSGGKYYDLTTISGVQPRFTPIAINQTRQILFNDVQGGSYLATPIPAAATPPPGSVAVSIVSDINGAVFLASGTNCSPGTYATPQTLQWAPGASCTVQFLSPQSSLPGDQFLLARWQDGSVTNPRTFVAPSVAATYSVTFTMQYLTNVIAQPAAGGTVTGGGWLNANATGVLTATPALGFRFIGWYNQYGPISTAKTYDLFVSGAQTIIAKFVPSTISVPGTWSATTVISDGFGTGVNSFGRVAGASGYQPVLWTPLIANSVAGALTTLSGDGNENAAVAINDDGQVLLGMLELSGTSASLFSEHGPAALWTPSAPQGTSGATTSIGGSSGPISLNSYGQVGLSLPAPGVWTPSSPNSPSGSFIANSQLLGLVAINGYGQGIINPETYFAGESPQLFTPAVHNGASGTFTPIAGLPGSPQTTLVALTEGGAVLGYSCMPQPGGCQNQAFLWTPSTANGTSGTTTALPVPSGFVSVTPMAINAGGAVVGVMTLSSGLNVPFLYTGSIYSDLSSIPGVPLTSIPASINGTGQIVLNSGGPVLLVMPATPVAPTITSTHPGSFLQGESNAPYTLTVTAQATAGLSGTVTVVDSLPPSLTATAIFGTGWSCTLANLTCTRSDGLIGGTSYPSITVRVNVASNAPGSVTNQVSVTTGFGNSSSADVTTIIPPFYTTIQTNPAGLPFLVDGGSFMVAPQSLILAPGPHTLYVNNLVQGTAGTQYLFLNWSDGGYISHSITVGTSAATYTATYKTQYQLTVKSAPASGGVAAYTGGPFFDAGSVVPISETPNAGYAFSFWSGDIASTNNSQSITMNAPHTVTANFSSSCLTLTPNTLNVVSTGTSAPAACPDTHQSSCGYYPETPLGLTVQPGSTCTNWTATSSDPTFVQIAGSPAGNGPGPVSFTAFANPHTLPRNAVITVTSGSASSSYLVNEAGSTLNITYRQIYALYQQLLGRDPDSGGFAFWSGVSAIGLGQMGDDFLTSPEAFNVDFAVMAAYQAALGAPPNYAQYSTALAGLRAGTQTVAGLFSSLITGSYSANNLYQNLLNRPPQSSEIASANSAGLASWFQTLIGYPATIAPVGAASNEFQSTGAFHTDHTNALYIRMLYYLVLSRDPDSGGLAFWQGVANSGGPGLMFQGQAGYNTRIQITGTGLPNQGFIGSPEFQGLFAN